MSQAAGHSQSDSSSVNMSSSISEVLKPLRDSIVDKPPYVSGTLPLPAECFSLFYKKDSAWSHIDLANATPEQMQELSSACEPASFGLKQENVLDETYRKAGKLDSQAFVTPVVPERTSLTNIVREYLLEGKKSSLALSMELYKLNVYDKGSFFKAHVDTPRNANMFGSLVLVFPTPHDGGSLLLRARGEEWAFDSAKALAEAPAPSIGFVAFFSDVEHEVSHVTNGHRVTLTFNLYLTSKPAKSISHVVPANELLFKSEFQKLLDSPTFLPNGGALGFGLRHAYPVKQPLEPLYNLLKGSDAVVLRISRELSLEAVLYLVYTSKPVESWQGWCTGMLGHVLDVDGFREGENLEQMLQQEGGIILRRGHTDRADEHVEWVTKRTSLSRDKQTYLAHGNEPSLEYAYGDVSLVVRIGKYGDRSNPLEPAERDDSMDEDDE
ncbi:hypothetical protein BV25DRAFT_1838889 [Artomyces pyxidatus]|uniref:Uncharacterized protein n=1 Tax=Artomyces pyxidatus TaxID=48021 RepID=A0ACB8T0X0_9AGAM|nr:hypothetical protein BV25DRAFT_1838889 [Artomyces pyxidatus]